MIGVEGARYKSMEFTGEGLKYLKMSDRLTMANMAIEAGAKNGIFEVDEITMEYLKDRAKREPRIFKADEDAEYDETIVIDLSEIRPTVAFPHLPENTRTIDEVGDISIDQVVIGSCTNGNIEDMETAAKILKGRKVADNVRCIIFPGTQNVYKEAIEERIRGNIHRRRRRHSPPTCGPCLGGHMGVLAARRESRGDHQPELCRTYGPRGIGSLSGKPGGGVRRSAVAGKIAGPDEL